MKADNAARKLHLRPNSPHVVRMILIGSPAGVRTMIHQLHQTGTVEADAWCPAQRLPGNPRQVISIGFRSFNLLQHGIHWLKVSQKTTSDMPPDNHPPTA